MNLISSLYPVKNITCLEDVGERIRFGLQRKQSSFDAPDGCLQ